MTRPFFPSYSRVMTLQSEPVGALQPVAEVEQAAFRIALKYQTTCRAKKVFYELCELIAGKK